MEQFHGTTILSVRRDGAVALGGDGQVTLGNIVIKSTARKVRRLYHERVLAGFAGNICVLFTANDAYLRDFHLFVPGDCIASESEEENHYALQQMAKVLKADIRKSTELEFSNWEGMDE